MCLSHPGQVIGPLREYVQRIADEVGCRRVACREQQGREADQLVAIEVARPIALGKDGHDAGSCIGAGVNDPGEEPRNVLARRPRSWARLLAKADRQSVVGEQVRPVADVVHLLDRNAEQLSHHDDGERACEIDNGVAAPRLDAAGEERGRGRPYRIRHRRHGRSRELRQKVLGSIRTARMSLRRLST